MKSVKREIKRGPRCKTRTEVWGQTDDEIRRQPWTMWDNLRDQIWWAAVAILEEVNGA